MIHKKKPKVILITGGRSGLGFVIAKWLYGDGNIIYCTTRNLGDLTIKDLNFLSLNIISDADVDNLITKVIAREGRVDVLINNAGITLSGPTLNFSANEFKNIIDTNVIGPFRIIKKLVSIHHHSILIINITSLSGIFSLPNYGLYSASKFALEALGIALRYELYSKSIRVVNLTVGALDFPGKGVMQHKPVREKSYIMNFLMPLTSPEKVAKIVGCLISSKNPPTRVLIGRDAHIINALNKFIPMFILEKIVLYFWNK